MSLALWLFAYLLITYGVGRLYEVVLGWKNVRMVFYPGMLVAALGRMAACLLGQQSSGQVDVMRSDGPSESTSDTLPGGWWFRFLHAIGPFALSLAAFILVWNLLEQPFSIDQQLPALAFETAAVEEAPSTLGEQLRGFLDRLKTEEVGHWQAWVFLYLGFAFIVPSAPSKDDLVSVGACCGAVGLIVFGLGQLDIEVATSGVYGGRFWQGFSFLLATALFVLLASLVVLLPLNFLRKEE